DAYRTEHRDSEQERADDSGHRDQPAPALALSKLDGEQRDPTDQHHGEHQRREKRYVFGERPAAGGHDSAGAAARSSPSAAPSHQPRRVHGVVLVVGAEYVHREIYREPYRMLALLRAAWLDFERPVGGMRTRESAEQVVRREHDLCVLAAHDRFEIRRAEHAT